MQKFSFVVVMLGLQHFFSFVCLRVYLDFLGVIILFEIYFYYLYLSSVHMLQQQQKNHSISFHITWLDESDFKLINFFIIET